MNKKLSNTGRLVVCLYAVAAGIGFLYTWYGASTGTGLVGWLMTMQLDVFGSGSLKHAVIATFLIWFLPLFAILESLRRFAPSVMFRSMEQRAATGASRPAPSGYTGWLTRLSWTSIFAYTGMLLTVTAAAYAAMLFLEQQQKQEKVYEVDLTSGPGTQTSDLPGEAKFAEVTGLIVRRYASVYAHGTNAGSPYEYEVFAPVTGSGWRLADPVRYFVHIKARRSFDGEPQWPDAYRRGGPAKISGQLGRVLPLFVESNYQAKGLTIAPSYIVVDWRDMPDHQIPTSSDKDIVLAAGLLFSVSTLLTLSAVKLNKKEILERRRQAGFD